MFVPLVPNDVSVNLFRLFVSGVLPVEYSSCEPRPVKTLPNNTDDCVDVNDDSVRDVINLHSYQEYSIVSSDTTMAMYHSWICNDMGWSARGTSTDTTTPHKSVFKLEISHNDLTTGQHREPVFCLYIAIRLYETPCEKNMSLLWKYHTMSKD